MMKGKIKGISTLAGMVFLSAAFFISPVYAMNRTADSGRDKTVLSDTEFIQELIDSTNAGETCQIPEGEYTVSGLSLPRPVMMDGGGNVTLRYYHWDAPDGVNKPIEQSYIFAVWSDGVVIDGFRFVNTDAAASTAIIHFMGDNLEIRHNTFRVGQNSAGIISRASAKQCSADSNLFTADSVSRTFPMIQFGENLTGARIKDNVLEGSLPGMLTSGFLCNFLSVESPNAVVADNEFLYTGPWSEEDLGGYEDSDTPITQEAFAEMTKSRIDDMNPWTRSMGDKNNPETGDGFRPAALVIACAAQIACVSVYMFIRRRGRTIYRKNR